MSAAFSLLHLSLLRPALDQAKNDKRKKHASLFALLAMEKKKKF